MIFLIRLLVGGWIAGTKFGGHSQLIKALVDMVQQFELTLKKQ